MGAVLAGLGGVIGGALGLGGDVYAAQQMSSAAQAQRDFEERMSGSAWQRGVADMRKAGINPALSYTQGPASTPSGATAQVPGFQGAAQGAASGISSAMDVLRGKAQIENLASDTQAKIMSARLDDAKRAILGVSDASEGDLKYTPWAALLTRAQTQNLSSAAALNRANLPAARITGSKVGGVMSLIKSGASSAADIARAALQTSFIP